jgi:hypothetical protein
MTEFEGALKARIDEVRSASAAAADADDWYGRDVLLGELEGLRRIALDHGLDLAGA